MPKLAPRGQGAPISTCESLHKLKQHHEAGLDLAWHVTYHILISQLKCNNLNCPFILNEIQEPVIEKSIFY